MQSNTKRLDNRKGFALVELLVAISIIVILSVSLLFQQNKFDSSVQITNVAQEIKSVIQQAQRYGTSSLVGDTDVNDSYGVRFTLSSNKTFVLFRDTNNDGAYTLGEEIEEYTIPGRTVVQQVCTGTGGSCTGSSLTITFTRPDSEPSIDGRIIIENDGEIRTVVVSITGQIQVIQ
jgi:prepilin-type N-terminal cleavage/methylation domain-containing protein